MNIIICGAGDVGRHAAEVLGAGSNSITVVDRRQKKLDDVEDLLDVRTLVGDCTHADVLLQAGCAEADLFIAATGADEVNLLSASVSTGLGAGRTIARVQHSAYFEERGLDYARHLGIDHLVCPDYSTAVAIAQTLRSPGALAVERFARGEIEVQQLPVSDNAKVVGKRLADLKLPTRVAAIERAGVSFIPGPDSEIYRGDVVTLFGETEPFGKTATRFNTEAESRRKIMIMGGTPLGVWLSRAMRTRRFSVRLFEQDARRCRELAGKLEWVTILKANPTDPATLDEERVGAVTDDDEHNILAAARAKSMGVGSAVAVVQRPTYMHLLQHVGIDMAFSPPDTAVSEIQRLLDDAPLRHVASLAVGIADVYEVVVPSTAKQVIDKPLREVNFPPKTTIAAIQRNNHVRVPSADDSIAAGDTVVVIGPTGIIKELKETFAIR